MSLSNDYTAGDVWNDAIFDFKDAARQVPDFLRFHIMNRAQNLAQGLVADVVAESYLTDLTPVFDNTFKTGSSGMSYVAATKTLTATMSVAFASTDVGKWVSFHDASNEGGAGTIATYVSATVVTLAGDNLPAADIATVTSIHVVPTTPSGDTLDVSEARILRAGTQQRIKLLSTATNYMKSASDMELQQFYTSAPQNVNVILWNLVGVNIYLKKGSSLSTYGTLTFRYPRLPIQLALDADAMDVLDGSMMQLTICLTKMLIAKRLGVQADYTQEIISDVQAIYRQFDREVKLQVISKKLEGLA